MTDAEIAAIVRAAVGVLGGSRYDPPLEELSLSAICGLSSGHPGRHASAQAFTTEADCRSAWLRWDATSREIEWHKYLNCPWPDPDGRDNPCMLFAQHPGDHCPSSEWLLLR